MISDVLYEAIGEMARYMHDPVMGRAYVACRKELNERVEHMQRVVALLDAPIALGEFLPKPNGGEG